MAEKLVDLSMPVHNEMVTFPRVVRPSMAMFETWQEFAERIGAAKYGVDSLTASYIDRAGRSHWDSHGFAAPHAQGCAGAGGDSA